MKTGKEHKEFWEEIQDYDSQVFSVFADKDAENPIFDYLKQKPKGMLVADLGCGSGNFLKFLSQNFEKIIAADYSNNLLKEAKKRHSTLTNIEYKLMDMKDLEGLDGLLDIAISINSILPETINEVGQIIRGVYKSLKPGGEFVGILPAADTVIYLALLEHKQLLDQGKEETEATKEIERIFNTNRQFSILGFQRDSPSDPRQKYFFPSEIELIFKEAGFKSVLLQKVYYSWAYCKDHNYGYFPGKERIWDWFVIAKK